LVLCGNGKVIIHTIVASNSVIPVVGLHSSYRVIYEGWQKKVVLFVKILCCLCFFDGLEKYGSIPKAEGKRVVATQELGLSLDGWMVSQLVMRRRKENEA